MNTNKNCESDGEVRIELETTAAASCDIESGGINNDSEILKDETLIGQSSRIFPQEMLDILKLQQEMLDENVADTYSSAKSYKKWNAMDNIARKKEYLTNLVGVSLKNPMMVELLEDNRELTERCNELMQKFDELSKSLDSLGTTMSFPISLPTIWESEENISETVASEVYETMSFPISLPTIWESEENISETVASEAYESPDIIEESDSISSLVRLFNLASSNSELKQAMTNCSNSEDALEKHDTPEGHIPESDTICQSSLVSLSNHNSNSELNQSMSNYANSEVEEYDTPKSENQDIDDSLYQLSFETLSIHTSNSELNLSNYINSEDALDKHVMTPEGHPMKNLISKSSPAPTVIMEAPQRQDFHVIDIINTRSSPEPGVMQRPSLCQRIWDALTDFCAAICLCLKAVK